MIWWKICPRLYLLSRLTNTFDQLCAHTLGSGARGVQEGSVCWGFCRVSNLLELLNCSYSLMTKSLLAFYAGINPMLMELILANHQTSSDAKDSFFHVETHWKRKLYKLCPFLVLGICSCFVRAYIWKAKTFSWCRLVSIRKLLMLWCQVGIMVTEAGRIWAKRGWYSRDAVMATATLSDMNFQNDLYIATWFVALVCEWKDDSELTAAWLYSFIHPNVTVDGKHVFLFSNDYNLL